MNEKAGLGAFVALAAAIIAFLTAYLEQPDLVRAGAAALCVLATAIATWWVTKRGDIVAGASGLIALWPGRSDVATANMLVASALLLLLLLPNANRWQSVGAGAAAALVSVILVDPREPLYWVLAVLLAGAGMLLRPRLPTRGMLQAIRLGSLYFPAIALAGLIVLNAVTDRGQQLDAAQAVRWGITIAVLLAFFAAAGLGLEILMRSDHQAQWAAWAILVTTIVTVLFAAPTRDPSTIVAASFVGAPIAALLAALFAGWVARDSRFPAMAWQSLPWGATVLVWLIR